MCSSPAIKSVVGTTARAVSGVLTLGGSEVARNNLPANNILNKVFQAPGNIVTGGGSGGVIPKAAEGLGIVPPDVPAIPPPPDPTDVAGGNAPLPTPGATTVDSLAAKRRKKLSALQAGLLSTIATSGSGLSTAATTLTPAAGGTTGKALLGQ